MRTRTKRVSVRLTEKERNRLNRDCRTAGMSREDYLRALIDHAVIVVRSPEDYRRLSAQITAIERNINQIAHVANSTGRVEKAYVRQAQEMIEEVRNVFQMYL